MIYVENVARYVLKYIEGYVSMKSHSRQETIVLWTTYQKYVIYKRKYYLKQKIDFFAQRTVEPVCLNP